MLIVLDSHSECDAGRAPNSCGDFALRVLLPPGLLDYNGSRKAGSNDRLGELVQMTYNMPSSRSRRHMVLVRWAAIACVCIAILRGEAYARLRISFAWEEVSPNGEYVLVLIPSSTWDEESSLKPAEKARVDAIRAAYRCSGVYRNDASRKLLWGIDSYCARGKVFFSQDGRYVVITGDGMCTDSGFQAEFLAAEREPKRHNIFNFVPFVSLKGLISERFFNPRNEQFLADELEYVVWTETGEKYVFDVKTGELIGSTSPWHVGFIGLLVIVVAAAGGGMLVVLRRKASVRATTL